MSGTNYNRNERDLTDAAGSSRQRGAGAQDARIPVAEERLDVEKRETELGEVQLRKTVTEEEQTIPVELQREEVHVREVNTGDRPVQPGENVFQEGTISVPVRGEEAVVQKQAVVTGEVVLDKERITEQQNVSGTVRRERVEVDEDYGRHRDNFQQHFTQRQSGLQGQGGQYASRTWEQAEPNYRYGHSSAYDERYQGREFDDVEPDLRSDYETRYAQSGQSGWQDLRDEVREGWTRARGR